MNYKSHTEETIKAAQKEGKEVYYLNTDSGDDDVLIGTFDECIVDICNYHEFDELPENWELEKIDWEI